MSCAANRNKAAKAAPTVGVAELANKAAALKRSPVGPQSKWVAVDRAFGQYRRRFVANNARLFNQAIQEQRRVTIQYQGPGKTVTWADLIPLDIKGGLAAGSKYRRKYWVFSEKRRLPLPLDLGRVVSVEISANSFEPTELETKWGRKNRGYTLPRPWGRTATGVRKRKRKPAAASEKKRVTAIITAVADLDWQQRKLLDGGGAGVIYRVGPGVVAKVGRVAPDEVEAQRHFARQGLAVPVLAYQAEVELPAAVSREVCPVHGSRREILPEGERCTCGEPQAVLVMPEADCVTEIPAETRRAFIMGFSRDAEEQLGLAWDARPQNMAYYQDRLVALDFGR
jgi:hypothetical protein